MNRIASVVLIVAAALAVGCGPNSAFDIVWPSSTEQFVRLEGSVCGVAEPFRDVDGVYMGQRFSFAPFGLSCDGGARDVKVPAALPEACRIAKRLVLGENVSVVGELAARAGHVVRETITARKLARGGKG